MGAVGLKEMIFLGCIFVVGVFLLGKKLPQFGLDSLKEFMSFKRKAKKIINDEKMVE